MKTVLISVLLVAAGCAVSQSRLIGHAPEQAEAIGPKSSLNEPPSDADLAAANFGIEPGQDYETQIQATMTELLKDPESARYRFVTPEQGWLPRYLFDERVSSQPYRHGQLFGWIVRYGVNAKNGYGGYGGEMAYEAFFENGQLLGILRRGEYQDIFGYGTWNLVASLGQPQ